MSEPTVETYADTATRSVAGRLGTELFQPGESAHRATGFPASAGLEASSVRIYLARAFPGIKALKTLRRVEYAEEDDTVQYVLSKVESAVAHPPLDLSVALAALAHDLGHTPVSLRLYSWSDPLYRAATVKPLHEEGSEPSEEELEMVDWDVRIETPPPRSAERVVVRFREGSYRPPRIVDDPED